MPIHSRALLTTLSTLALGACFDPGIAPGGSGGSASETEGTGTDPTSTTTSPDTDTDGAEGQADSTGAVDAPPELTAFTVNGSTTPAEQQTTGMVAFDVDATDDVGIDRIEIYDDGELVATVTNAPYQTELLLSSADNGTHTYSAIVFDTAGQTDESEVVALSVNVIGGAMLELREDIGDGQIGIWGIGAPKVAMLANGNVIVTGMARLASVPELRTGLLTRGYSSELSLLWSEDHGPPAGGMVQNYVGFSAPSIGASGQIAYVGGTAVMAPGVNGLTVFSLDTRTGALAATDELWTGGGSPSYVPVSAESRGNVFATAGIAEVARYSEDLAMEHWRSPPLGAGVFELASTSQGGALALFVGSGCAPGAVICLCKLSPEGDVLWTRAVAEDTAAGLPTRPTTSSEGHVAVVKPVDDGSIVVLVFDDQGDELASNVLERGGDLYPQSATYTPDGDLVVVGSRTDLDAPIAWATRLREDGNVRWDQTYEVGTSESVITGVATSPSGRLYVAGHADPFDSEFLTSGAHAWVAELAL